MADQSSQTTTSQTAPADISIGMMNTNQFTLKKLMIHTSDGIQLDISKQYLEINLFEDLFSPCMTGSVRVSDGNGLLSNFFIHGNEFIEIEIDKPSLETPISKVFRLYKIANQELDTSFSNYTLHFCSEEMILSPQSQISKSYKGLRIDQIISDILKTNLMVQDKKIDGTFSQTSGQFDIIIPKMNALEAIQWLSTRAYSDTGTLYFFFETINGFCFLSYEDLLKQPVYSKFTRSAKTDTDVTKNLGTFTYLKVVEEFDLMKASRYGAFSSSLFTLDLVNKKFVPHTYNAGEYKEKGILNKEVTLNGATNRLGKSFYDSYSNMLKYCVTADGDPNRNPISPEKWLSVSASKMGQLHLYKMVGTIPGDILIKTGRVIEVDMQVMTPVIDVVEKNPMRNGKYLVSAIHHRFIVDMHTTTLELLSDSVSSLMPLPNNNDVKYQELIKS